MTNHVPEPDQQKKNEGEQTVNNQVVLPISSGEDDSAEENDPGDMNGYQPLVLSENDAGTAEFHAEPMDSSDEDACEDNDANSSEERQNREIAVDADLVLSAMKGVSLPGSSIPPWAKELSDTEWNDLVKRTITGEQSSNSRSEKT